MKFLTSRVVVSAIASFIAFAIVPAIATTPEADFKTVTSKAYVDSLISNNDISGHKVNGAPLSNAASYFYGEGVGAADTATKTVSIPSITGTPAVGQVIVVKPATTNTASTMKINLNNTTAYSVLYRGSSSNIPKDVWTAYVPSIFVLDVSSGTKYWRYVGTSPVAMTWSATETAAANAYSTTFDGTTGNWPVADENKYVKGDSFAQGLALKQNKLPAKSTGNAAPKGNQAVVLNTAGNPSNVYTTAGKDLALTAKSGAQKVMNYIDGTTASATFATSQGLTEALVKSALVSLELLKDVYSELNSKITNNALPTGTAGTVVTYNGTNPQTGVQQFTETAIVDAPVYTNGDLTNGDSLPSVEYVEDALATKQPIIQPSTVNGKTQIVVKPAYGGTAGNIGYLTLDTASLTSNNSYVPSSKLVADSLLSKMDKRDAWSVDQATGELYNDSNGALTSVSYLYQVPGMADSGTRWAKDAMIYWGDEKIVPTMDTLAVSLTGVFDALDKRIQNYPEASDYIRGQSVKSPSQIEYTYAPTLTDGAQLFWLPSLAKAGDEKADFLLGVYQKEKIVPTMDELAHALDGVLQTHETTREWQAVLPYYGLREMSLFELADMINISNANAILLNRSGYLQTFAPTLEALMNESYGLYRLIDTKQNKLSGTNGALVTYGATAGQTGSKAIATSISNNANTIPNTAAVYNAVNARQNVIPVAGKYRSSNTITTDTDISDWTATNIKGTALVTKPTSANGVVGERKIFEAGDTYTNDAATNIQIATIGAVMENIENTVTKRCVGYKPGTSVQNAENCWLWEFVGNSASCIATGGSCTNNSECCSGTCGVGGQCN